MKQREVINIETINGKRRKGKKATGGRKLLIHVRMLGFEEILDFKWAFDELFPHVSRENEMKKTLLNLVNIFVVVKARAIL